MVAWNQPTVLKSLFTPCPLDEFKCDPARHPRPTLSDDPISYVPTVHTSRLHLRPSASRRRRCHRVIAIVTLSDLYISPYRHTRNTHPRSHKRIHLKHVSHLTSSSPLTFVSPSVAASRPLRSQAKSVCGLSDQKPTAKFSYRRRRHSHLFKIISFPPRYSFPVHAYVYYI